MKQLQDIVITTEVIRMLIDMGRLRWSQQADPLAVGQALGKLLNDWANCDCTMKEFIDREKRKHSNGNRT